MAVLHGTGGGARRTAQHATALALALLAAAASAGTFYVDAAAGDDADPGSALAPWATLQRAADAVGAGDRVVVRSGAYQGFYLDASGVAGSPIEFFAEPGAAIDQPNATTPDGINLEGASHVVIDGFTVTGMGRAGVRTVLADHVTIRNVTAGNNQKWGILTGFVDDLLIENNRTFGSLDEHGIYVSNSGDRPTIRGNRSWGNRGNGIHMNGDASLGGDGVISQAVVVGNVIFDNGRGGGSGINMDGVENSRIENNLLYNNHASGISLYQIDGGAPSTGNVVLNNTVHQASDGRWAINIRDGSTGNTVRNNILVTDHAFRGALSVDADSLAGFTSDNNVLASRITTDDGDSIVTLAQWQAATLGAGAPQDAASVVAAGGAAALFVNPAAGDYRLRPAALALDRGAAPAPGADLAGVLRPQGAGVDAGALERVALAADFNGDRQVNAADVARWSAGFGSLAAVVPPAGNSDDDQDADGADFLAWQRQFGATALATPLPEPCGLALSVAAAMPLAGSHHRVRRSQRGQEKAGNREFIRFAVKAEPEGNRTLARSG